MTLGRIYYDSIQVWHDEDRRQATSRRLAEAGAALACSGRLRISGWSNPSAIDLTTPGIDLDCGLAQRSAAVRIANPGPDVTHLLVMDRFQRLFPSHCNNSRSRLWPPISDGNIRKNLLSTRKQRVTLRKRRAVLGTDTHRTQRIFWLWSRQKERTQQARGGHELTDAIIKKLPLPASGNTVTYDEKVKGFGIRITAGGARSFVLNYRTRSGRERRYTLGSFPNWTTKASRAEAERLKREIRNGHDPLAEIEAGREAPTVADLCQRFAEQYLPPHGHGEGSRLRASTRRSYRQMIDSEILPTLKHRRVSEVTFSDIDGLHHRITKRGTRYAANRTVELLRRMFNLAIRWGWCSTNPARGIERNREEPRHRYLSGDELRRLTTALGEFEDQQAANIFRMLLLTGARKGEVLAMRWPDLDLTAGTWTKPGSATKQKTVHRSPLSAPALQILAGLRQSANAHAVHVFPGTGAGGHRVEIKFAWSALCQSAGIKSLRIHDLRHSYASQLVSAGFTLPVIGALLGHSQPATTARYAHLFDEVTRQATERVGAIVAGAGKPVAEPVPFKRTGR